MKKFPQVITYRITSRCNSNCKYCFGPKNVREMGFKKEKEMFGLLHKGGVKAILLTGGEPLIRSDFGEILKELKKYNFKVFLDTNGDLFSKCRDLISKYVDVIGLPIDFPNRSYRNKDNFNNVLEILSYYKNKQKRPVIRIGTVVTKDNFRKLNKIEELLKNYSVDIWKIYQFTPQSVNALENRLSLEITQKEFNEVTKEIKNGFSNFPKLIISGRKDRNAAYFFINPDGTVIVPIDDMNVCRENIVGNIFNEDILEKWEKLIHKEDYINNTKLTFNYKF